MQHEVYVGGVGGQHGGDQGAHFFVADADGVRVGEDVHCGGVGCCGREEGGEESGDFVGGVDGVAVLEGLGGGRVNYMVVSCEWENLYFFL